MRALAPTRASSSSEKASHSVPAPMVTVAQDAMGPDAHAVAQHHPASKMQFTSMRRSRPQTSSPRTSMRAVSRVTPDRGASGPVQLESTLERGELELALTPRHRSADAGGALRSARLRRPRRPRCRSDNTRPARCHCAASRATVEGAGGSRQHSGIHFANLALRGARILFFDDAHEPLPRRRERCGRNPWGCRLSA